MCIFVVHCCEGIVLTYTTVNVFLAHQCTCQFLLHTNLIIFSVEIHLQHPCTVPLTVEDSLQILNVLSPFAKDSTTYTALKILCKIWMFCSSFPAQGISHRNRFCPNFWGRLKVLHFYIAIPKFLSLRFGGETLFYKSDILQTHVLVPLYFISWIEANYRPSTHQELHYLKFDLTK